MIKKSLFLIFIFIVSFQAGFKGWQILYKPRIVHIYLDIATVPSLLQMVDYVNRPVKDKKYIAWRRFPDRAKYFNLANYNTEQINLPQTESHYKAVYQATQEAILQIIATNPDKRYIIHANLRHPRFTLESALKYIPPEKIQAIHLYEDGLGNLLSVWRNYATSSYNWTDTCVRNIKDFQKGDIDSLRPQDVFCLYKLYPTTYHISFVDEMKKQDAFNDFFYNITDERIVPIDFNKIANELPDEKKKMLFTLVGFNEKKYREIIQGKRTVFYTQGWLQEQADNLLVVKIFNALKKNELNDLMNNSNTLLFFKAHPATAAKTMQNELLADNPKAIFFPRSIPMEILIIAGLTPDYLLGYSSTIFFSFPNDKILYYLTMAGDKNIDLLQKLKIITPEKIINITDYKQEKGLTP